MGIRKPEVLEKIHKEKYKKSMFCDVLCIGMTKNKDGNDFVAPIGVAPFLQLSN